MVLHVLRKHHLFGAIDFVDVIGFWLCFSKAGANREARTAIMAITTNSSMSVNPLAALLVPKQLK